MTGHASHPSTLTWLTHWAYNHGVTFPGTKQDEALAALAKEIDDEDVVRAVQRSSLGTPDAVALRATVNDETARRVVDRAHVARRFPTWGELGDLMNREAD